MCGSILVFGQLIESFVIVSLVIAPRSPLVISYSLKTYAMEFLFFLSFFTQLKLRPAGRLNVQVRHFREGEGNVQLNNFFFFFFFLLTQLNFNCFVIL